MDGRPELFLADWQIVDMLFTSLLYQLAPGRAGDASGCFSG